MKVPCGGRGQRASITQMNKDSREDTARKSQRFLNLSKKKEEHEGVVRNAHWCCRFPWRRQRRDVGSAAGRRGGSSCWLKWARGSWGCRGSCGWGGFRDRRRLQEIERISVQNKRPQVRIPSTSVEDKAHQQLEAETE